MESFTSLWWDTWIIIYKLLVAYVHRRSQAFGGYFCGLQSFGGRWSIFLVLHIDSI